MEKNSKEELGAVEIIRRVLEKKGLSFQNNLGFFLHPMYTNAIVGQTVEGNLIYDYDKIVEFLQDNLKNDKETIDKMLKYNLIYQNFADDVLKPILMHPVVKEEKFL